VAKSFSMIPMMKGVSPFVKVSGYSLHVCFLHFSRMSARVRQGGLGVHG